MNPLLFVRRLRLRSLRRKLRQAESDHAASPPGGRILGPGFVTARFAAAVRVDEARLNRDTYAARHGLSVAS